jgi:butyrate kinase
MAAALKGEADAIIITGGIAYSEYLTGLLKERVAFIAPLAVYPGEFEMQSLALNSYKALIGEIEIKDFDAAAKSGQRRPIPD